MDEAQLTQEAVAERTGKDRATVANSVRLLKLEPKIQDWIEEGKLTAGHGRALLAVPDSQLRMRYAQRAARGGLTVRQIEKLPRGGRKAPIRQQNFTWTRTSVQRWMSFSGTSAPKCFSTRKRKCARGNLC